VRSEKVVLVNGAIEAAAQHYSNLVREGSLTAEEASQLSVWEASLAEARACLAKLLAELETYEANRQVGLTAALVWAVLQAKLPEETTLRCGLIFPQGSGSFAPPGAASSAATATPPLPHLWALSGQPPRLLPLLRRAWGEGHPRAAAQLFTDLGGHAVSHLVDAVVLGQELRAGRKSSAVPYLGAAGAQAKLIDPARAVAMLEPFPTERLVMQNLAFIAEHTRDYLMWGVPAEVRAFVYPIVLNAVLKDDPTRIEYVRLDEEQVRRFAEAQRQKGGEAGGEKA